MGPLRLAWAKPLRIESGDRISKIQFQIGSAF
jgi:outer membrane protein assembly factor BamA